MRNTKYETYGGWIRSERMESRKLESRERINRVATVFVPKQPQS
jgi:hypothetical protein